MNLIRPLHLLLVVATAMVLAPVASAGSWCSDDPERCVERGTSVSRPASRAAIAAPALAQPTPATTAAPAHQLTAVRKPTPKPVRVTPRASAAPAPTPGMGMLLKLSSGTGGDVSWSPARNVETSTGASWIL